MLFNYFNFPFTFNAVDDSDSTCIIFDDVEFTKDFGVFCKGEKFFQLQLMDGNLEVWEDKNLYKAQDFTIAPSEKTTSHMRFQVLQDGKPCSEYKIEGYNVDKFETLWEAQVFAECWSYPFTQKEAQAAAKKRNLQVGLPQDMSMGFHPVMIEIIKVTE